MTTTMTIDPDLRTALKRVKLGKVLDTLPERLAIAKQQKLGHQELLLLVLHDEIARREAAAATSRAERAHLDPEMQLERWDSTSKVTYDRDVFNDLVSLCTRRSETGPPAGLKLGHPNRSRVLRSGDAQDGQSCSNPVCRDGQQPLETFGRSGVQRRA
jgi:hypothetical protein